MAQVIACLTHLHQSGALDAVTFREVDNKLKRAILREPEPQRLTTDPSGDVNPNDPEEVKLGKRNAYMRKAMTETELLPKIVETALNAVGFGLLGDTQIDAIVELVSMSQKQIADAVTDPRMQEASTTSAFVGVKTGLDRGSQVAGKSLSALSRKKEEMAAQSRKKKEEKQEQKELQAELKREREAVKERITAPPPAADDSRRQGPSEDEDDEEAGPSSRIISNSGGVAREGPISATVSCIRLGSASSAAITNVSPFPGLTISSTIVASPSDAGISVGSNQTGRSLVTSPRSMSTTSMTPSTDPPRPFTAASRDTTPAQTIVPQEKEVPTPRQLPPMQPPSSTPSSTLPPPIPPPQHRDRPPRGQRRLEDTDRAVLHPATDTDRRTADSAASTSQPEDEVVDVTDKKQKSWKNKFFA